MVAAAYMYILYILFILYVCGARLALDYSRPSWLGALSATMPLVAMIRERHDTLPSACSSSLGSPWLQRNPLLQAVADVLEIRDADTFVRPIYAGNALATVKALGQGPRLLTVRPTAFAAAPASSGSATMEAVSADELTAAQQAAGGSEWVGEDVRKSGAWLAFVSTWAAWMPGVVG